MRVLRVVHREVLGRPLARELDLIRSRALAAHLEEVTGHALVTAGLSGGGAREHQGDNELLHCAVICACGTDRRQSGDAPVNTTRLLSR